MPTQFCPNQPKLIAQTLFLGASVSSYNVSAGWGSQPSQLTVNLIEDENSISCRPIGIGGTRPDVYDQFSIPTAFNTPNHYHTCSGDSCYADKMTGQPANSTTPMENKIIAGKVYYYIDSSDGQIKSLYWTKPDPGFFGNKTVINDRGTAEWGNALGFKYDIIDTPVYFKMGDFTFGGFVQSWSRNLNSGGKQYTVTVNGASSILNSCYVILDKFAGSVFSKSNLKPPSSIYGSPKNTLTDTNINYNINNLNAGIIPNIFNVYGFLESFGTNYFGGAGSNENGVSLNYILRGLSVLTSNVGAVGGDSLYATKSLARGNFSTFGRIISKCIAKDRADLSDLYSMVTNINSFGIVPPTTIGDILAIGGVNTWNGPSGARCQFTLDLTELLYSDAACTQLRMPDDIRISTPTMTVMELINYIADKIGHDVFIEMSPTYYNSKIIHVIKVRTISRLQQPRPNVIENTIKTMECNQYTISSSTFGKEKNETPSRAMIIGGQQQRLYQVKSYRLAYSQSSFIYNPKTGQFINYYKYNSPIATFNSANNPPTEQQGGGYGHGKIKAPNFGTTRNPVLNDFLNNSNPFTYHNILKDEDDLQGTSFTFEGTDSAWQDTTQTGSSLSPVYGNYKDVVNLKQVAPANQNIFPYGRWIPLYMDTICPFFGYVHDENIKVSVNTSGGNKTNTDMRQVRPVWFDSWTGQIAVVLRVSELPLLNVSLNKATLGSDFPLPYTFNSPIPSGFKFLDKSGTLASNPDTEYFYITESEIRAALAGFDNFLVYSLAKTYKPDLIEMVRRAYYLKTLNTLTSRGTSAADAKKIAAEETDWYWKLMGGNIGGDDLYPVPISPDKNDGSQYIQEKALQDLRLLHKFVSEVGKYYGKKYMVTAWDLSSYKDTDLMGTAFQTSLGYGYLFTGNGNNKYNYVPTNDGAWEEYGNIIDDSIVVGGPEWYSITDDTGKIKPLLGYNNNYNFDHVRYAKCMAANNSNFSNTSHEWNQAQANPYFSYNSWLTLQEAKTANCSDTYVFPTIDISSLATSEYVIVDQKTSSTPVSYGLTTPSTAFQFPLLNFSQPLASYNAWGEQIYIKDTGNSTNKIPLPKSKLYTTTTVEEDYIFLDPLNESYAKILIDAPAINLYVSSEENSKDPNRTVLSNVAAEDLLIYLKTTASIAYDYEWIKLMLNYIVPYDTSTQLWNNDFIGAYASASNTTANNVELAPKAAHPFFVGIPIKSNQYVYGPWINYPHTEGTGLFPSGISVIQTESIPPSCTISGNPTTQAIAENALNNMITSVDIEIKEDFVPWNFGSMYNLDIAAYKEIETKINYQSIIETAQVDMPGLPIFNLGGSFTYGNIGLSYSAPSAIPLIYTEFSGYPALSIDLTYAGGSLVTPNTNLTSTTFTYNILQLPKNSGLTDGPIISNIQTSVGQQGITTTYSFRTYTRKIGLFNKEETDRIKKLAAIDLQRNKQIAKINFEMSNTRRQQQKFMTDERLNKAAFGSSDLSSQLYGWSPSMVLIAQARPIIEEPIREPKYIEDFSLQSTTSGIATRTATISSWAVPSGSDPGDGNIEIAGFLSNKSSSSTFLKSMGRISTTTQIYQRKEANGQLDKNYGMQSAMSLDGLLSPISFYPTLRNSTYSYSLHDTAKCPFCKGTKIRSLTTISYLSNGQKSKSTINVTCDKCTYLNNKLNAKLNQEDADIPINLITLNPIVVPYGEFKNSNTQHYNGAHPDKLHDDLSNIDAYANKTRYFHDRLRHSIEIVARGSVPPQKIGYDLEMSRNIHSSSGNITDAKYNLDYYHQDIALQHMRDKYKDNVNNVILHETNQRFIGLRGPLVLHSWGYDQDGYPVPNAADEPRSFDEYGRPFRFKIKVERKTTSKPYKSLSIGESFTLTQNANDPIYAKTFNQEYLPASMQNLTQAALDNTQVFPVTIENDLKLTGGYDPALGYTGDIIGKTQKWNGSKWSEKVLTNDFYLNWAERPDLWKVGPIDLIWDEERKVWTGGSGCGEQMPPYIITNSNDLSTIDEFLRKRKDKKCPYQNIYATLEEDLIKQPDFDETYAARAFIDDLEYSKSPLLSGYRRLIYIKDKCGYTAPRGTKLLCRYNRLTGFYEPISKPIIMAKGLITSSNTATIELTYIQGRRSGVIPSIVFDYSNPMGFSVSSGRVGMFSFINGSWTLISIKQ